MFVVTRFAITVCITASALPAPAKIDFKRDIAPVFEKNCVSCHHAGSANHTRVELSSRKELVDRGMLVPGNPARSPLFTVVQSGSMPPAGKLPAEQVGLIRNWIEQDAPWPSNVSLKAPPAANPAQTAGLAEIEKIRQRILTNHEHPAGTKTYKITVPNTTVSYEMTAIPAGEYQMGSSAKKDEQPPHQVKVPAFWMQTHEVTWDEYRLFMFANQAGEVAHKDDLVDAVSRPTRPYVEMSFGMGINGFPAISMTQHAANKYAEWLSAKTGEFYRLPTEAEWEYACRAGSSTTYYFGDDAAKLGDYAWYTANSGGKYQKVATKKPNAWGLFDMLGNVMEWTLDQYEPYKSGEQTDPWLKPKTPYPISVRGGSWNDPATALSCAARVASDASWKQQDPQLPKSIWYETDAQWLGFRLIRPAAVPTAQEMYQYWNNGVEHDEQ
jgi:formylglycine-generating enzyme required for sulfatase activity